MTGQGARRGWCRALWGHRTRTLVLVASGVAIAGAGIAYLRSRRQRKQQQQLKSSTSAELNRTPTAEAKRQDDNAPSAKEYEGTAENGQVQAIVETDSNDIAAAAAAAPLLSGTARGGASTEQHAVALQSASQFQYLTSTGPNRDLLKMMEGGGAVGGFGDVTFWQTKSGLEVALKMAKDTVGGRKQQDREIQFLVDFTNLQPDAANIVSLIEARTTPSGVGMLLMRKEPQTLSGMLEDASSIDIVAVFKALSGILNAVEVLHRNGFVQRDIKGDNILVGKDGDGILVDFGLCIKSADASLPEFLGDGTAEYSAPEVAKKLSGSNLCTELFSLFVVFVESVMMRHPFGGEDLFDARADRFEYLEEKQACLDDNLNDITVLLRSRPSAAGESGDAEGEGEAISTEQERLMLTNELEALASKLENVRIQQWRLGVRSPRQWRPEAAAKKALAELGKPLSFLKKHTRRDDKREAMASDEAKTNPSRLFEGDDWVDWLPGPSRADCKEGLRLAVEFVLRKGVFHPDPESRPQTVEAARDVLAKAVAIYEDKRAVETKLEEEGVWETGRWAAEGESTGG